MKKKILIGAAALVLLLGLALVGAWVASDKPRPSATAGAPADALAQKMMEATGAQAWEELEAVSWDFAGRNQHLWDKKRGLIRVRWEEGAYEALVDLRDRSGVVRHQGQALPEDKAAPLRQQAWEFWINDSFWLNPVSKLFDPGVERGLVKLDQGQGLLMSFPQQGGATPGDAYLWVVGPEGQPQAWRMWVSIIPVGGVEATWEGWQELPGGARVATRHEMGPVTLELTGIKAGALAQVEPGADPFAELIKAREGRAPAPQPSSGPAQ